MGAENECLGCGVDFDYDEGVRPECDWDPRDFSARSRYGLANPGHREPDDEGDGERDGGPSGPPPGPKGLL